MVHGDDFIFMGDVVELQWPEKCVHGAVVRGEGPRVWIEKEQGRMLRCHVWDIRKYRA